MLILINQLNGITSRVATRLNARNIDTGAQLLKATRTPQARQALAREIGVDQRFILDLAGRADLARVPGLDATKIELLEAAGVHTVDDLVERSPPGLCQRLMEINYFQGLAELNPTLTEVSHWIAEAKTLPSLLEH